MMNTLTKDFLVDNEPPRVAIVGLHGLGSDGHDIMSVMNMLNISQSFRAICPTADTMNITINKGMPCNAWFDILDIEKLTINYDDVLETVENITNLLDEIIADYDDVFLMGFSQGGAIALTTGLIYDKKLSGIVGLSTFFPNAEEVLANINPANKDINILITHGLDDEIVDIKFANDALLALENAKINTELKTYQKLHHSIDNRVMEDMDSWIKNILKVD